MFYTAHSEASEDWMPGCHLPSHYKDSEATLQAVAVSVCAFECVRIFEKDLCVALVYCILPYFFETGPFTEPRAHGFS